MPERIIEPAPSAVEGCDCPHCAAIRMLETSQSYQQIPQTFSTAMSPSDRLSNAGFTQNIIEKQAIWLGSDSAVKSWYTKLSDQSLEVLASVATTEYAQDNIMTFIVKDGTNSVKPIVSEVLTEIKSKSDLDQTDDSNEMLAKYLVEMGKNEADKRVSASFFADKLAAGAVIISDITLFGMFDRDPVKVEQFTRKYGEVHNLREMVKKLFDLKKIKNLPILFEGLGVEQLEFMALEKAKIFGGNPVRAAIYNSFIKKGRDWTWVDSITSFNPILESEGLMHQEGPEVDTVLMERIRRRENPDHPFVTLGFAPTLGWEIEYPNNTSYVKAFNNKGMRILLYDVGFRLGTGGTDEDEASPGPFYDPLTAVAVYRLYAGAKVIDTSAIKSMTFHFNFKAGRFMNSQDAVPVVRGEYLGGYANNPHIDPTSSSLYFNDYDPRTEGKVYSVISDEGFERTFMESSRKILVARAAKEMPLELPGQKWREQFAQIHFDTIQSLREGLESIGMAGYLDQSSNQKGLGKDGVVGKVRDQLKRIFDDPTMTYVPDVNIVGQKSPDKPSNRGIKGLEHKGIWYRNIVQFARSVNASVVTRSEEILDSLEAECVEDIRGIEAETDYATRLGMIVAFNAKYNVKYRPYESDDVPSDIEAAYSRVRNIFFALDVTANENPSRGAGN